MSVCDSSVIHVMFVRVCVWVGVMRFLVPMQQAGVMRIVFVDVDPVQLQ